MSLDELQDLLAEPGQRPKLLSIDVFDTVVTRACGRPSDLFVWLGRRLAGEGLIDCTPEVFAHVRASAEQAVWRREGGLDSTAGLREFYIEAARRLHLDEEMVPAFVEAELNLESAVLRPVPAARRLLEYCRKLGIEATLVSDTYLSTSFVESRLYEMDLLPTGPQLLVSSQHANSKASGRLFEKLFIGGLSPVEILHVGDHPHSDVASPQAIGIKARWCVEARLNRYEEQLSAASTGTAGMATSVAGASRLARLATEARTPRERAIRDVAAGVAAPALVGYVLWLLKRAQKHSLKRLVFLARDGQVLADIARRLVTRLNLTIEIRYLFVSRRSTNLAATFAANEDETSWVFRDVPQLSITKFLERFDLDWMDVSEWLGPLDEPLETAPASKVAAAFREQLASGPIRELVLNRAAARREIVVAYLRQEGMLDDLPQAIVDFGGVGSQVRALYDLIETAGGQVPQIFMIGIDDPEEAGLLRPPHEPNWLGNTACYLYDYNRKRGIRRARGFVTSVQMFCAADHGTVINYHYQDGVVTPELEETRDETLINWGLPLYRATVANFVDNLVLERDLVDPYADLRDVTCNLIDMFWKTPDRDQASAWGTFPFEGAQASGGERKSLVRRYTLRSISREIAGGRFPNLGWQHWYEGSLAVSGPAIRTAVTLAETAYRRAESKQGILHTGLAAGIRRLSGR